MRNVHLYPSNFCHESRILKEAATLSSMLGFKTVDLVGVSDGYLPSRQAISDRVTLYRLGPAKGRGAMKAVRHLFWCLNVIWFCLRRRYRIVNCHSLPVLPIGVILRGLSRAKVVYDTHELETETAGSSPQRRKLGRLLERACMRFVALVVVVSPGIEKWYRRHYGIERIVTVLNAPRYREPIAAPRRFLDDPSAKVVLYQGVLGRGRGLEHLVGASAALAEAGYELVLLGYGPMADELSALSRIMPFHVVPAVPPGILLEYTASACVGICLIENICLSYHLSLPNKLFEYVMARVPVVAADLPEIRNAVDSWRVGTCLASMDPVTIVNAVRTAEAMRDGEFLERAVSFARTVSWERQEELLCNAYLSHVLT
jgi:glycosyltransferase involved in cell wall biosynthesis